MSSSIHEPLLEKASTFIAGKMGLYFPEERLKDLERAFIRAAKELGFASTDDCIFWFLKEPLTREKTEILAGFITIGETYFFRENQCFEVLEQNILPEMMREGRQHPKRLRIWSAGCATGEEPYSIAIMLHRMKHMLEGWEVFILATDINMQALQRAMKGVYSAWSFRNAPDWLRKNYFNEVEEGRYELIPEIRRMVNFSYLNLAENLYPSLLNETNALDIIFCRNVLMYFTPERIKETLERFSHCLLDKGWMIVSSCETSNLLTSDFSAVYYPNVILYRKTMPHIHEMDRRVEPIKKPAPLSSLKPQPAVGTAAAAKQLPVLAPVPLVFKEAVALQSARDLCRICANEGRLDEALRLSEQAIALDKLNAGNHYMRAMILLEQDKKEEAAAALRNALYLDHDYAAVHFMLGSIARQSGQNREAKKHFQNALAVLDRSAPESEVPDSEGLQAGKLAEMIRITISTL